MTGKQQARGAPIVGVLDQFLENRETGAVALLQQGLDLLDCSFWRMF